jgi:hypothetical protein
MQHVKHADMSTSLNLPNLAVTAEFNIWIATGSNFDVDLSIRCYHPLRMRPRRVVAYHHNLNYMSVFLATSL